METETIKPSRIFYGVSVMIFVIGIVLFIIILVTGILSGIEKINNQIVIPGTEIIELDDIGKYTIFFEYRSVIDGKVYETNSISGLTCSLKNIETGEYIELNNTSVNSNYSVLGREGRSIFDFSIDEAGKYEIKAWYESGEGEEAVLAIGKGFNMALIRTILLSIGVMFISFGLSLAIFLYTLFKRKKAKDSILEQ